MHRRLALSALALAALLAAGAAPAQPAQPLHPGQGQSPGPQSTGCHKALAALQTQESAVLAARQRMAAPDSPVAPVPDAPLEGLRKQAAQACLGGDGQPPPPAQHIGQQPVAVPPILSPTPSPMVSPDRVQAAPLPRAAAGVAQVPPARPAAPPTVTGCDQAGCWASDGTRLNRVGPVLQGPRGMCTVQGALLNCP